MKIKHDNARLIGVEQVAEYIGIGREKVRELMQTNKIRSVYVGNTVKTRQEEIEKFLEEAFLGKHADVLPTASVEGAKWL